jgi:periplasmic protein TonB
MDFATDAGPSLRLPPAPSRTQRNFAIAASVVVFHIAALWALQSGLLRRAVEIIVPAEVIAEFVTPPAPKVEPVPVPKPPEPVKQPVVKKSAPREPTLLAVPDARPQPNAPAAVPIPQPPAPPIAVQTPPAPVAPAKVELPSTDADYLQNPKPAYPPLSKRLGEQGKVVVHVLIGTDGTAQKAEIRQSSGFERLDNAALTTAQKWRYVPGKRAGVPEAMWFNVPINFVLE